MNSVEPHIGREKNPGETFFQKGSPRVFSRLTVLVLLLLCLPGAVFGQEAPDPAALVGTLIKTVDIVIDAPWAPPKTAALARDLIVLAAHEPFTVERYQQSVSALELSGSFEEIHPALNPLPDGLAVVFALKPARTVRDIRITGAYPLFKSDILKAMSVYPGDAYHPASLAVQEALISDLYAREGYILPVVAVTDRPEDGTALLDVRIKPGPYYRLDEIAIRGNRAMSDNELKSHMTTWRSSFFLRESARLRQKDLDQDIKNLTALYWQRRYPECEIRPILHKNPGRTQADLVLTVVEGPRYEVLLTGHRRFWAATLKKDIVLFTEGNPRDRGLRKSIANIKHRYRLAGYPFTTVQVLEEKIAIRDARTRRLEFAISEGPRPAVKTVRFSGNTAFDAAALTKTIATGKRSLGRAALYVPDQLDADLATIQARYLQAGYPEVKINADLAWSSDKTAVEVTVQIAEGIKTTVTAVNIPALESISPQKAAAVLQLKAGEPFQAALLKTDETALANRISETGRPYVTVQGATVFSPERAGVELSYRVNEGPFVRMGNVYYRGNFKTRQRALRRQLGIDPGEPFALTTLMHGQKNIRDMGIFDTVQFKTFGLKEGRENVTLLVDLQETPPYYLQSGLGYTSDRGLYGNARVGDRNLLGLNNDAWLGGEISQIGYNGEVNLSQRRLFGTPIVSTLAVAYARTEEFNQSFGTSVWTSSLSFLREFAPQHLKTALGLRYERRNQFAREPAAASDDTYAPRSILVTSPSIAYDTRDSFVRPTSGGHITLSADISQGLQNSLDNFLKYTLTARGYWSPVPRVTLAAMGRAGYIDPMHKGSSIPEDQLFYLGGTFSVRGFDENMLRSDALGSPLGGRVSLLGSLEARLRLGRAWEATLFSDTGAVRRTLASGGSDAFRSSAGLGLRYLTPIGPMGLLYGQNLNPKEGEPHGRIHFSIGYTF